MTQHERGLIAAPSPAEIRFAASDPDVPLQGNLVILAAPGDEVPARLQPAVAACLARALEVEGFAGKAGEMLRLVAPDGTGLRLVLLLGTGSASAAGLPEAGAGSQPGEEGDWLTLGGVLGAVPGLAGDLTLLAAAGPLGASQAAAFATGFALRRYRYAGHRRTPLPAAPACRLDFVCADLTSAEAALARAAALVAGVTLARDLSNAPANLLGTLELAEACAPLAPLGVEVEILDEQQLAALGMGAVLAVGQGSPRPPRVAIVRWAGGIEAEAPLCFVGKGVVFDTGGNTMKPGAGMEAMKGDMCAAAAIIGLMRSIAGQRLAANVTGIIGIAENMVDGAAMRPGDVITSLSGQTIEVTNTDAEGRLVLADVLYYAQTRLRPRLMVDVATLTGVVIDALDHAFAGIFSNDDDLACCLIAAGEATGERLWRLPLDAHFERRLHSGVADMVNFSGRRGNASVAAQLLQRFVGGLPWAHLDITGMTMGGVKSEICDSWGSGFGVRLLERFVHQQSARLLPEGSALPGVGSRAPAGIS